MGAAPLFMLGTYEVGIVNVIDLLIAVFLVYQVYKLLRGGIAFNIFIGIVILYSVWWIVKWLEMPLLSNILGAFMSVGVLIVVIIFQPEIRRFLLYVGNTTVKGQNNFLKRLFPRSTAVITESDEIIDAITNSMMRLSKSRTGMLIVLSGDQKIGLYDNSGVVLDAKISEALLESIFMKDSPLHDGAVIIAKDRIYSASAVMPVSENTTLATAYGLRHRAAIGISEDSKVVSLVVSEETGDISYAIDGQLRKIGSRPELKEVITRNYHLTE